MININKFPNFLTFYDYSNLLRKLETGASVEGLKWHFIAQSVFFLRRINANNLRIIPMASNIIILSHIPSWKFSSDNGSQGGSHIIGGFKSEYSF